MPINLKVFSVQTEWQGCTWSIPSIDELANAIAIVAMGQSSHVAKIMHAAGLAALPTTKGASRGGIKLLTVTGNDPSHRDGWMFQVMSWLAAQKRTPGALLNVPHMIHAHKGLDGLQVDIDAAQKISAVVLFEDKATTNPRSMVTSKVWPEFEEFETGDNEHLVTSEVTSLLARAKHPDPEQAVAAVMWTQVRRFRLSITDEQSTDNSQAKLFKGYSTKVTGGVHRRRAEVFAVKGLREWMDELAQAAIKKVRASATRD
ncbi:hypothetical protein [Kerstersia sp.]|uniref:hypothetical protein n=1 Tax=Kerstersia sp. TaxID=1930783 RepID=UPI003F90AB2D